METKPVWTCACGQENKGKFCIACGKPRPAAASPDVTFRRMCLMFALCALGIVAVLGWSAASALTAEPLSVAEDRTRQEAGLPPLPEGPSSSGTKAPAQAAPAAPAAAPAQNNGAAAQTNGTSAAALQGYYKDLTNRKWQSAYARLSPAMQQHMGAYDTFAKGYETTLSATADNLRVISADKTQETLTYQLTSRDRAANGKVKVQRFTGQATLQPSANGTWKITDMNVKKQSESWE
ncbi:hypothetical protein [uncultured Selenomonas sp.]|uniref:hypothetical protein n=1 Tax=uncultured Selenomonas sp. TaxID=159275 RepID=UPI0025E5EB44|nr:hypothetical protein [uncultured Selenomonas sp.]